MREARTLELFFLDGEAEGLTTAEVFGWTGFVIRIPRLRLKAGLDLREAAHTGVYILLGQKDGVPTAYIGEAESLAKRIRDHDASRQWWDDALLITTSSDALHKAHVKYLESRLVEEAMRAGKVALENGNIPPRSSLNRASKANMEAFLETLFTVLPPLNVTLFQSGRLDPNRVKRDDGKAPEFVLKTPKNKVEGRARLEGADFVVLAGSRARRDWAGKGEHDFGYKMLHAKLIETGVLRQSESDAEFTEDYAFNSPSAAAAVMNGRPANGRIEWKEAASGRSYAEWEDAQLAL